MNTRLMGAAIALVAAGCAAKAEVDGPALAGKADISDDVSIVGALTDEVTDEFTAPNQYFGWTVQADAGATISRLEITQRGTARGIDSTLFVYGPKNAAGDYGPYIAFDDDDGWGTLSRIEELQLRDGGEYLVVAGLYPDTTDLGAFRVEITCDGCTEGPPAGPTVDQCDELVDHLDACFDESDAATCLEGNRAAKDGHVGFFDCCVASIEAQSASVETSCEVLREEHYLFTGRAECNFSVSTDLSDPAGGIAGEVLSEESITAANVAMRPEVERRQIVAMAEQEGYFDSADAAGIIEETDDDEIVKTTVRLNNRNYEMYVYYLGDNAGGVVFRAGRLRAVAYNSDGDIAGCEIPR